MAKNKRQLRMQQNAKVVGQDVAATVAEVEETAEAQVLEAAETVAEVAEVAPEVSEIEVVETPAVEAAPVEEAQVSEAPADTPAPAVSEPKTEKRERVVKGRWTEVEKFKWVHSRTGYVCQKVDGVWKVSDGAGTLLKEFKHLKEAGKYGTAHMKGDIR